MFVLFIFDVVEIELDPLMEWIEERVEERLVEASIEASLFLLGLIYSKLKRDATIAIDLHEQLLLNDSLQKILPYFSLQFKMMMMILI